MRRRAGAGGARARTRSTPTRHRRLPGSVAPAAAAGAAFAPGRLGAVAPSRAMAARPLLALGALDDLDRRFRPRRLDPRRLGIEAFGQRNRRQHLLGEPLDPLEVGPLV